jgi:TIR domain
MAYLTENEVRARAARITQRLQKSAGRVLAEAKVWADESFQVFLSHSSAEPEEILLGLKALLEDRGLSVYVDKYGDPQFSPDNVTQETAEILRRRMQSSDALLYIHSQHSKKSRWMPWELGYFDGLKGTVGILPVTVNQEEVFKGEEYLNLYPYVDIATMKDSEDRHLWINEAANTYARLDKWATGNEKIQKRN